MGEKKEEENTFTNIWYGDGLEGVLGEKNVDEPGTLEPSSPSVCVCVYISKKVKK